MKLCLLVSRRCDLRCGFCQVEFTGKDMSWETARRAVDGYRAWLPPGEIPVVKFFGGEPLLNFGLIRRLVEAAPARWAAPRMRFELSTNGSFLDEGKRSYFRAHPEVEVTLSQKPEAGAGLARAWYTLVLDRGCQPKESLGAVKRLFDLGYRRFNILPAYYVVWRKGELAGLRRSLQALSAFLRGLKRLDPSVRVKNAEASGPVPLYNDALTVDVDGEIYASNMVQCHGMEPYRRSLRLGTVADSLPWKIKRSPPEILQKTIRSWAGPEAWRATARVDRLLSEFVGRLS